MTSRLEVVPAPVRRFVGFTVGGVVVYFVLMTLGVAFFPSALGEGSIYPIAAVLLAGLAAYHMVYRGGYGRLYERFR